ATRRRDGGGNARPLFARHAHAGSANVSRLPRYRRRVLVLEARPMIAARRARRRPGLSAAVVGAISLCAPVSAQGAAPASGCADVAVARARVAAPGTAFS